MTLEAWKSIVRLGGLFAGAAVMGVSLYFSADGFGIKMPDMIWLGYLLGLIVIYCELYINHEGIGTNPNLTLIFVGLVAYIYGIYTNFLGIMHAMGIEDVLNDPMNIPFPFLLALILEILPEPLILYALVGTHGEDILSKLFNKSAPARSAAGGHPMPMPQPAQMQQRHGHPSTPPPGKTPPPQMMGRGVMVGPMGNNGRPKPFDDEP